MVLLYDYMVIRLHYFVNVFLYCFLLLLFHDGLITFFAHPHAEVVEPRRMGWGVSGHPVQRPDVAGTAEKLHQHLTLG